MPDQQFFELVGAIGAAAGSVWAVAAAISWNRTRTAKRRSMAFLEEHYRHLSRIDRRVTALAVELDRRFAVGVGWTGISIWPDSLAPLIRYGEAHQQNELEHQTAELRAHLAPNDALDRLRADLEELTGLLHRAFALYLEGSIESYLESEGESILMSAGGRETTPSLGREKAHRRSKELVETRDRVRLLLRTCAHRLGSQRMAGHVDCGWPVRRWEVAAFGDNDLWQGEPRPL